LTIADLQLLNNVIIIKSKVLLPQVKVTIADLLHYLGVVNRQWSTLPEGGEPYF
jgi:hypothetical protein